MKRKYLTKDMVQKYLKNTPTRQYGSDKLFRNLEEKGLISYSEYLFLLCVITSMQILQFSGDFELIF